MEGVRGDIIASSCRNIREGDSDLYRWVHALMGEENSHEARDYTTWIRFCKFLQKGREGACWGECHLHDTRVN